MDVLSSLQASTQAAVRQVSAPTIAPTSNPDKADEAAKSFEAFFIGQYLEQMFAGIRTDGMFGGGHAENVYRSLMLQEVGKNIADSGGIGIADSVRREILHLQEQSQQQERRP